MSASAESDFNASEDFFTLVVRCHIISAAMQYLEMESVSDVPVHRKLSDDLRIKDNDTRMDVLKSVVDEIVLLYVNLETSFCDDELGNEQKQDDKYQSYASDLLSMGLFCFEFVDSIKEGDGQRILRCWRYLLLIFKAAKRKNYSIEALNLLCQYHFF